MKQLSLLICLAGFAVVIIGQPIWTDAGNKRIMEWDSSYSVEIKRFYHVDLSLITNYYILIKKDNKLTAEYFRHDDSSYLFIKYDSLGNQEQRGLIKYVNEIFWSETIKIHDWLRDPEAIKGIEKDTFLSEGSFRKKGMWKETDSTGMIWKGEYKNGVKEGEWMEGTVASVRDMPQEYVEIAYDNFRSYITHNFKNGNEILLYKDSIFWPLIKGGWERAYKLSANTIVWERQNKKPQYYFADINTAIIYKRPLHPKDYKEMERITALWKQKEDQIEIVKDGKQTILRMLNLRRDQMIFRILQQDL